MRRNWLTVDFYTGIGDSVVVDNDDECWSNEPSNVMNEETEL
jgi:hypothetical protein